MNKWQQVLFSIALFSFLGVPAAWANISSLCQEESCSGSGNVKSPPKSPHLITPRTIAQSTVQITQVRLATTATGLEIVLETSDGILATPTTQVVGNALIAEIANAVLVLPSGETFEQLEPGAGIAQVSVTNLADNRVQITITGKEAPPSSEAITTGSGLSLLVIPGLAQTPNADENLEIVVTGEREEGLNPTNTSTATKTDTPLRDIPQSVQIIPQQLLRDQQITRLEDALRNVPGISQSFSSGPLTYYTIRGFEVGYTNFLRDGIVDPFVESSQLSSNVERIEVLKGPASVLFGKGTPGGTINVITKRPLREPEYSIDATIGSDDLYRGAVDLSAPLNDSKTILYRLNASYKNAGSFIDFYDSEYINFSPVITIALAERTNLILEGEYVDVSDSYASGLPVIGTVVSNPNGKVSRTGNFGEPSDEIEQQATRFGYKIEHAFSDNWSLQNSFQYGLRKYQDKLTFPQTLDADNRTFNRIYREYELENNTIALVTDVVGKFSTGSIEHQLLFGLDLSSFQNFSPKYLEREAAKIDIFNPVYGKTPGEITYPEASEEALTNSLGVYLQDQIAFTDNFKLLIGGRFDTYERTYENFTFGTKSSGSETAFSPRVGIVYQPIPPISLYASYVSSFTPPGGTYFFSVDSSIEAERGNQYEVGVKADINERLSLTLALYDLTRTNVLTDDPNNPGFSIAVGEQNSQGIELSLTGEILPGWNVFAGYAYMDARVTEDNTFKPGNQLPNTPEHSFNFWTTYQIQEGDLQGLGAGLGFFFEGDRAGDLGNTYTVPSYFRTDASIFYDKDNFRVALNFKNIFDIEYFGSGLNANRVYYGQPFAVQANISWKF